MPPIESRPQAAHVYVGQWIHVFDNLAEVLGVYESKAFPGRALQLHLRVHSGESTTMLVPVNYEPTTEPVVSTGIGGRMPLEAGRPSARG